MPTSEVILIENIPGLGAEADVVKVKSGYARNFLLPTGKAFEVTPTSLRKLNQLKAKRAEREARELNEAEDLARKINKLKLTMILETGESGKAFGSITANDIAEKIQGELGGAIVIDRHRIVLDRPIKDTGPHEVAIKLHTDVTAKLNLQVQSKADADAKPEERAEPDKGFKARPKARHTK
jgi:large subunit ribosomal protein L9